MGVNYETNENIHNLPKKRLNHMKSIINLKVVTKYDSCIAKMHQIRYSFPGVTSPDPALCHDSVT